jgi:hypothetical protein
MAGVLSMSQFRSPNSTNSEDRSGAINSNMVSRAQLGAKGGESNNGERLVSGKVDF